jgi:hypothetical protein
METQEQKLIVNCGSVVSPNQISDGSSQTFVNNVGAKPTFETLYVCVVVPEVDLKSGLLSGVLTQLNSTGFFSFENILSFPSIPH